jgi:serine protease Do
MFHTRPRLVAWPLAAALVSGLAVPASGQDEARQLSARFREAAERVLPAVVTVRSGGEIALAPRFPRPGPRGDVPFPMGRQAASGLVVDAERGLVLTTDHALIGAPNVRVILPDGRARRASKVARDPRSDLALVTIEPEGLDVSAEWGDSEALGIGDWVLAIGQAFGFEGTVTAGIVSGTGRSLGEGQGDLIQTDAAIQPGHSGGPLIDLDGRVVGICLAIGSRSGLAEGVGLCIPAARAKRIAEDLAEHGRVRRAYLGVRIEEPTPELVAERGRLAGVRVGAVVSPGPASEAGIEPGDLILRVGDRPVTSTADLQARVEFAPIGEPLGLTIRRGEEERTLEVRPEEMAETVGGVIEPILPGGPAGIRQRLRPRFEIESAPVGPREPKVEREDEGGNLQGRR